MQADRDGIICRSSIDAIRKITAMTAPEAHQPQELLFTADFTSLYTSLKHDTILTATLSLLRDFLAWDRDLVDHVSTCLKELLHSCVFYEPRSMSYRLQTVGVPMGGAASGDIANCVLLYFELKQKAALQLPMRLGATSFPRFYTRYIDDCLGLGPPEAIQALLASFPQDLPLVVEHSGTQVPFLDISLSISSSYERMTAIVTPLASRQAQQQQHQQRGHSVPYIRTNLYEKGLSAYQYVIPSSGHRRNLSQGIIAGALTRLAYLCDTYERFDAGCALLWPRLKSRGYQWKTWCRVRYNFMYAESRRITFGLPRLFPPVPLGPRELRLHLLSSLANPCASCTVDEASGLHVPRHERPDSSLSEPRLPRLSSRLIIHVLHNQFAPDSSLVRDELLRLLDDHFGLSSNDYPTLLCWSNQGSLRPYFNRRGMRPCPELTQAHDSRPPLPSVEELLEQVE